MEATFTIPLIRSKEVPWHCYVGTEVNAPMPSSVVLLLYSKPRKHDQVLNVIQYHEMSMLTPRSLVRESP